MDEIINTIVDSEMESLIADLRTLIRCPSVSAKRQGLVECAKIISHIMHKAGIKSEILYLDNSGRSDDKKNVPPPIIYGEVKSKSNPNAKPYYFITITMFSQRAYRIMERRSFQR